MEESTMEKMETVVQKTENMEAIYWGYLESKDVLDTNGEYVGVLRGILIADNWTIPEVVIEVSEDVLDELGVETPLLSDALVNLPSKFVRNRSDVVQLTENVASLKGAAKPHFLTKTQVKARIQKAEERAVTKVKEAKERAKADALQMSGKAKKAAQEAREKAKANAHQANERVKMTVEEAKEKVKKTTQEAKGKI